MIGMRSRVLLFFSLLTLLASFNPSWATDKSSTEMESAILEILKQRHPSDRSETWIALGDQAPLVIIEMYEKIKNTYHKVRLLEGLGWFDRPEALEFLKKVAQQSENSVTRNTAIRSAVMGHGVKGVDFAKGFLEHSDPQTRLAVAKALTWVQVNGKENLEKDLASEILESYLAAEKTSWVVKQVRSNAARLNQSRVTPANFSDLRKKKLVGKWVGIWFRPQKGNPSFISEAVSLVLFPGASSSGELHIQGAGKVRLGSQSRLKTRSKGQDSIQEFRFSSFQVEKTGFQGKLEWTENGKTRSDQITGKFRKLGNHQQLEIHFQNRLDLLVLSKSSARSAAMPGSGDEEKTGQNSK